MKVQRNILLLIAGLIWFIAGFNIMRIGLLASAGIWLWWMLCISAGVFLLFHNMVFRKMVKKHTKRILGYEEERLPFYRFFDRQAYCIMIFMMTFGIGLRVSGLAPDLFIAVFYSGLGFSLIIAGVAFALQYMRTWLSSNAVPPQQSGWL